MPGVTSEASSPRRSYLVSCWCSSRGSSRGTHLPHQEALVANPLYTQAPERVRREEVPLCVCSQETLQRTEVSCLGAGIRASSRFLFWLSGTLHLKHLLLLLRIYMHGSLSRATPHVLRSWPSLCWVVSFVADSRVCVCVCRFGGTLASSLLCYSR